MTTTLATRSYTHVRTYGRLNRCHLMLARCVVGDQTSLAVVLDRHDEPANWTTLARYPDSGAGEKACSVLAKAVMRAAIELAESDGNIDIA